MKITWNINDGELNALVPKRRMESCRQSSLSLNINITYFSAAINKLTRSLSHSFVSFFLLFFWWYAVVNMIFQFYDFQTNYVYEGMNFKKNSSFYIALHWSCLSMQINVLHILCTQPDTLYEHKRDFTTQKVLCEKSFILPRISRGKESCKSFQWKGLRVKNVMCGHE